MAARLDGVEQNASAAGRSGSATEVFTPGAGGQLTVAAVRAAAAGYRVRAAELGMSKQQRAASYRLAAEHWESAVAAGADRNGSITLDGSQLPAELEAPSVPASEPPGRSMRPQRPAATASSAVSSAPSELERHGLFGRKQQVPDSARRCCSAATSIVRCFLTSTYGAAGAPAATARGCRQRTQRGFLRGRSAAGAAAGASGVGARAVAAAG
jgi:hypothetical protein